MDGTNGQHDGQIFDGAQKILAHCDRLDSHARGRIGPPVTIELDLTNDCPHRCPRCVGGRTTRASLAGSLVRSLLMEAANYGVRAICFTGGGDPLAHPEAVELIRFARSVGLDAALISNGMPLAKSLDMATALVQACEWIRISIDAGDAETYRRVHGVQGFSKAWQAVANLAAAKARLGAETTIGVGYLLGVQTIGGMVEATAVASEAGADYIQFRPFVEEAGSVRASSVASQLAACRAMERPGFRVGYLDHKYDAGRMARRNYARCHGCYFTAVIQADGNVPLCCLKRGRPEFYGGSLHLESFTQIWEGSTLARLREIDPSRCPPLCRHDTLNELVEVVVSPKQHVNFL